MTKFMKLLASPLLMAILIIAFAVASGIATFIENDFGTQAARAIIYNVWWFELIMIFLVINFSLMVFTRKLYRKEKWSLLLFHLGFVVIILGAGITRYFGQEGMMHIREGETAKSFISTEKWLSIYLDDEQKYKQQVNFTPVSRNRFNKSIVYNDISVKVTLTDFVPHAVETVVEHFDGYPVVSLIVLDSTGNIPALVRPGMIVPVGLSGIGFSQKSKPLDVELAVSDTGVVARSVHPVLIRQMQVDEELLVEANTWFKLNTQTFYKTGMVQFAFRGHWPVARIKMVYNPDPQIPGRDVLICNIEAKGELKEVYIPVSETDESPVQEEIAGVKVGLRYGSQKIDIPFGIKLNNFILDRYPGSESPSSFTSNVEVIDSELDENIPFSIYMNNILNYKGYRFYQSSYDPDEKGTYLSVNNDFWGINSTYFGYFLMILGMLWALLAPGTRFRQLISKSAPVLIFFAILLSTISSYSQNAPVLDATYSREFGKLLVQDKGGRVKPLSTLSSEVLRKLNKSTKFEGQTPEQVYLGMSAFPDYWQHTPIVKLKNNDLKAMLGVRGDMAAFVDFFDHQAGGAYKLSKLVQEAYALKPAQRSSLHKEIIKADEKVNILYMIFSGQMARIFPLPQNPKGQWLTMADAAEISDSSIVQSIATTYAEFLKGLRNAESSVGLKTLESKIKNLQDYQYNYGSEIMPAERKVNVELIYNRLLVFERLISAYGIIGLIMLILVFTELFKRSKISDKLYLILALILFIGFTAHTIGIGLRWYIAGRAPLSNAFESMVYVAWAAMLAGFIFSKRSRVVLPATALISMLTLFVAHLSWMDPEITNLVPVLKSYWLTIHVAVITASYGFFGLGAILGFFSLILLAFKTKKNKEVVDNQVNSITLINELNLTLGLYLLTIGSFLGAVWANESWGRYWGWDPKETWALITILVYAFILHMRLIPSIKSAFAFNFGALIGLSSVLMTYFGVNYYLSGLHSYAGGDPVPIPSWLFFVVAAIFSLSFFAWYNNRLIDGEITNRSTN